MSQNRAAKHEETSDQHDDDDATIVKSSANFKFDDDAGSKIAQYTKELWDVYPGSEEITPPTKPKRVCDPKYAGERLTVVRNGYLVSLEMMLNGCRRKRMRYHLKCPKRRSRYQNRSQWMLM